MPRPCCSDRLRRQIADHGCGNRVSLFGAPWSSPTWVRDSVWVPLTHSGLALFVHADIWPATVPKPNAFLVTQCANYIRSNPMAARCVRTELWKWANISGWNRSSASAHCERAQPSWRSR